MRLLDIVRDWPGGLIFPRLLKCSGFFKLCQNGERLHGNSNILSQGAITREYIVDGGRLSSSSMAHNSWSKWWNFSFHVHFQWQIRLLAVRSLMQLMGSWRILSEFMWRPDKQKLPGIILLCCLLYNIRLNCRDKLHPDAGLLGHRDSDCGEQTMLKASWSLGKNREAKHLQHNN